MPPTSVCFSKTPSVPSLSLDAHTDMPPPNLSFYVLIYNSDLQISRGSLGKLSVLALGLTAIV